MPITWPKRRAASGPAKGRRDFLTYEVIVVDLLQGVACLGLWGRGRHVTGTLCRAILDGRQFHQFKAEKLTHRLAAGGQGAVEPDGSKIGRGLWGSLRAFP